MLDYVDVEMGVAYTCLRIWSSFQQRGCILHCTDDRASRDIESQTSFHLEASAPECCNSCLSISPVEQLDC